MDAIAMRVWPLYIAEGAVVSGLLVAEAMRSRLGVWVAKPIASAIFVTLAIVAGAAETAYGGLILVALGFSFLGDVLLIPRAKPWFALGLGSFLCGHIAYGAAFLVRGSDPVWTAISLAGLAFPFFVAWRWLAPHLDGMRIPVLAYMGVISAMVALALGTLAEGRDFRLVMGALLFYVSDLAVARDRFVSPGFANRACGLPVYYAAQVLLASTVGR